MDPDEAVAADEAIRRQEALRGPDGQALLERLRGLDHGPDRLLRLTTELRAEYPAELVADALALADLRDRAGSKFGRAQYMFLTRDGLEQASSEAVAAHRAGRFAPGSRVLDLCCGIGGDLVELARDRSVLAVDRDPVHLWMAARNAEAYGVGDRVHTRHGDVREVDPGGFDGAFVDPARRSARGRMRTGTSEPPLDWCLGLAERVPRVGIKAAPGIEHGTVPPGWEIEFLSVGRDIKEAVAWSPALATGRTRATVLPAGDSMVGEPDPPGGAPDVEVAEPGAYLLDPNPAVTRAGLVSDLARRTGTWKIDDRIAFLSAGEPVRTPFARTLQVIDSGPWNQKRLPRRLAELDVGSVDIRRRGLAGDVDALARKLRLRGSRRATLVMTRVADRPWGLVCVEPL